jgi:hypothetical protein
MIKALAPRILRGCSWVWLSIAVASALVLSATARGQEPPKTKSGSTPAKKADSAPPKKADTTPAKKADEPAKKDAEKAEAPVEANADASPAGVVEYFKDPRAEDALAIFKTDPTLRDTLRPQQLNQIKAMAANQASLDSALLKQFVVSMAARLQDRSNINALISPPPGRISSGTSFAIRDATNNLLDALNSARVVQNQQFLSSYTRELLETLPKLLDKNLVTRTEAMIVLGQVASPEALPIYLAQIKDPNQTVQVKLWAVRGVARTVDNGARLNAIPAADALVAARTIPTS